jgi:hypothetical protein
MKMTEEAKESCQRLEATLFDKNRIAHFCFGSKRKVEKPEPATAGIQ